MADSDLVQKAFQGYVADLKDGNAVTIGNAAQASQVVIRRRRVSFPITDGGTAATAQTETVAARFNTPVKIISVNVAAPVAVTASDTNYATVNVAKRTGGGASVNIATGTTQVTGGLNAGAGLVAFVPYALTNNATAANLLLAAGDVLTLAMPKTGTGVAMAAATSQVCVDVLYEENF